MYVIIFFLKDNEGEKEKDGRQGEEKTKGKQTDNKNEKRDHQKRKKEEQLLFQLREGNRNKEQRSRRHKNKLFMRDFQ